jgi:hypothetical protein
MRSRSKIMPDGAETVQEIVRGEPSGGTEIAGPDRRFGDLARAGQRREARRS